MNKKLILVGIAQMLLLYRVSAQQNANDTTIKPTTIEITQIYKPQVKQAVKETYIPAMPTLPSGNPSFEYQVPLPTNNFNYKAKPLQALAYQQDTLKEQYVGYVKTGLGNLHTYYLDAGFGKEFQKDWKAIGHLGFLSQKGDLKYQQQTLANFNALLSHKGAVWTQQFTLDALYNQFYQYGYDHLNFPSKIPARQQLAGGQVAADFSQHQFNKDGFRWLMNAQLGYYNGLGRVDESVGQINIGIQKKVASDSSILMDARLEANNTHTQFDTNLYKNNFASLCIGFRYDKNNWLLIANLKPTIGQNGNTFLLHDVFIQHHFQDAKTNIALGMQGLLNQNSFKQSYLINPFIGQYYARQTHSDEIFAQIEKAFGRHFVLKARGSWWRFEQLASFINNPLASEQMLSYYQPRANAGSLQLMARYQIGQKISVGVQTKFIGYSKLATYTHVFHLPTTNIAADLCWRPMPTLTFTAYAQSVGGNYALDPTMVVVKLPSYVDLGFGAEYVAMKKISFFINFNNLLNSKYQRWMGYQAYGINIYGGMRLKF